MQRIAISAWSANTPHGKTDKNEGIKNKTSHSKKTKKRVAKFAAKTSTGCSQAKV
jgi:hypothetical protein